MIGLFIALVLSSYVLVPIGIIWGWARFIARREAPSTFSIISCIGFGFATASAVLVAGTALYANAVGGFVSYDPRLKQVFRLGILLTAASVVTSLIGIWRKNPLRWFAPACSAGMTVIWLYLMAAE